MLSLDTLNTIILQLVYIANSLVCLDAVFECMLECVEWVLGGDFFFWLGIFLPSTNFLGLPFILNLPSERQSQDWDQ